MSTGGGGGSGVAAGGGTTGSGSMAGTTSNTERGGGIGVSGGSNSINSNNNGNNGAAAPVTFSQVPGNALFRGSATNAVGVIPLLSSNKDGEIATTQSAKSFRDLLFALRRYANFHTGEAAAVSAGSTKQVQQVPDDLLLVVPNSSLTRPGDWRYDNTPLKHFHWGHGCQRILVFDGRPQYSRMAHDRLINHALTRDWIDLCPSRRTAAVIGVLNMRDCPDLSTLHRAEEELQLWADRYSTPPYEVTAHGRGFERDTVVKRLFVFDSFDEACQKVDLTKAKLGSSILAFPPADQQHVQMMDLHLNVVVNDLAVAIFQQLEKRIKESDIIGRDSTLLSLKSATQRGRLVSRLITNSNEDPDEPKGGSSSLSLNNIKSVLTTPDDPASLASGVGGAGVGSAATGPGGGHGSGSGNHHGSQAHGASSASSATKNVMSHLTETANKAMSSMKSAERKASPQLLTPMDDVFEYSELSAKDADAMRKREAGRREKFAADLSLLAGSPMDAYERYLKAAEMCKSGSPDPLWYASAMEGCAAAHIAMSEAGGYNVDEYLENNFQFPDEIMTLALMRDKSEKNRQNPHSNKPFNKQTLPHVISRLGDEALNITCRHPQVAPFHADLLLKLASYCCDGEQRDLMCRWGHGEGCYAGDLGGSRRWEKHSLNSQMFADLRTRDGEDIIANSTIQRCRRFSELLHRATSTGALDHVTRVDVATRCITMCMKGLKPTIWKKPNPTPITFPRKAAFFTSVAAEAASVFNGGEGGRSSRRVSDLWLLASKLYARTGNTSDLRDKTRYGWATLRASTLHALSLCERGALSSEAAEQLLSLLSEITPDRLVADDSERGMGGAGSDYTSDMEDRTSSSGFDPHYSRTNDTSMDNDWSSSVRNEIDMETLSSLTSRGIARVKNSGIFSQMTASSSLLTVQGKWADDYPIPQLPVPLVDSSDICHHVLALSCVWSRVRMERCSAAQKKVIHHIFSLRKALPASSLKDISYFSPLTQQQEQQQQQYQHHHHQQQSSSSLSYQDREYQAAPPLYITSVGVAESEPSKMLERIQIRKTKAKNSNDAMATFFNPYENKKKANKNKDGILVAEGEERFVSIHFGNRLSVPLEIPSCQIEFGANERWRILAPSLSFVIPAKSTHFAIHFPFKPISRLQNSCSRQDNNDGRQTQEGEQEQKQDESTTCTKSKNSAVEEKKGLHSFEMKGLKITCLGRVFFVPIHEELSSNNSRSSGNTNNTNSSPELPESASEYPRAPQKKKDREGRDEGKINHRFEVVPSQPRLTVSFSGSMIDDQDSVSVYLSDGEIFVTRPFILENHVTSNGCGHLERLQIVAAGLPGGHRNETLYDSKKIDDTVKPVNTTIKKNLEEKTPPLKINALCSGLDLDAINSSNNDAINSSTTSNNVSIGNQKNTVSFQIIAANEIGIMKDEFTKIRLRFRYRGQSPNNNSEEIWRKREVVLRIVRVKGPRISSLTFRPDLTWGSAYSELCSSLSTQNSKENKPKNGGSDASGGTGGLGSPFGHRQPVTKSNVADGLRQSLMRQSSLSNQNIAASSGKKYSEDPSVILTRVGMDKGVHVCSNDVVLLLSVANETNVDIELSNKNGLVGGFEGNPLSTVRVSSGVSVRIPVVLPRISRVSDGGIPTNIVEQLVSKTALQWKEVMNDNHHSSCCDEHSVQESLLPPNQNSIQVAEGANRGSTTSSINGLKRSTTLCARQGWMRIPPICLKEIVSRHPSFASRVCDPPCSVKISIGQKQQQQQQEKAQDGKEQNRSLNKSNEFLTVTQGNPLDVFAEVELSHWVPEKVAEQCSVTLEFVCARKEEVDSGRSDRFLSSSSPSLPSSRESHQNLQHREYVWCGQVRKTILRGGKQKQQQNKATASTTTTEKDENNRVHRHRARVIILQPGHFVVSACAKIEHDQAFSGAEEIWWTPVAENVIVEKTSTIHPAQ